MKPGGQPVERLKKEKQSCSNHSEGKNHGVTLVSALQEHPKNN
jgi:hypothetical protein